MEIAEEGLNIAENVQSCILCNRLIDIERYVYDNRTNYRIKALNCLFFTLFFIWTNILLPN